MKTFIIAEAGINHNGNINTAKKLIDKKNQRRCNKISNLSCRRFSYKKYSKSKLPKYK